MKYLEVTNKSNRTLFIDTPNRSIYADTPAGKTVAIPAGDTINDIDLDSVQVANFVKLEKLTAKADTSSTESKPVVGVIELPEEYTAESLSTDFSVDQLKAYCKANQIKGVTGKSALELAEMIVVHHTPVD